MPSEKLLSFNCLIGLRHAASLAGVGPHPVVCFTAATQHMVEPNAYVYYQSPKVMEITTMVFIP